MNEEEEKGSPEFKEGQPIPKSEKEQMVEAVQELVEQMIFYQLPFPLLKELVG